VTGVFCQTAIDSAAHDHELVTQAGRNLALAISLEYGVVVVFFGDVCLFSSLRGRVTVVIIAAAVRWSCPRDVRRCERIDMAGSWYCICTEVLQ
jgi:hypothetical protein